MGIPQKAPANSMTIDDLRAYYHSVNDAERADVIELLGSMNDPDAARELISLYTECQWRATRLQIIRALSQNPNQRSLEFLFQKAQEPKDIPIAEAAVWSLGQTHHVHAARFLVHFYRHSPEFIKPGIIGALGQIPDRTLAKEFLEELPRALKGHHSALVKNLVLTLGELKVREALPVLEALAADRTQPAISLAALLAIGKISRDPRSLEGLERCYRDDLFEYQLFTSIKTQVQFRSQWRLEDYLTRIFNSPSFHRTLPFELSHFKSDDVREGLRLFAGDEHLERLCLALAKIDFPGIAAWYPDLIDFKKLSPDAAVSVLKSIASHLDAEMSNPLAKILENRMTPDFTQNWLETVSMALPDADKEFKAFFTSDRYRLLDETGRVQALNHLINFGLCVQTHGSQLEGVARNLEQVLEGDPSPTVQARALRGLGHLGHASKKALNFARDHATEPALTSSSLRFLELCPDKNGVATLLGLTHVKITGTALLKALAAQETLPDAHPEMESYLRASLAGDPESRIEALRLLARHPRKTFVSEIAKCLKGDDRVILAAVISLKSHEAFADDSLTTQLAPLLQSKQHSISGRALDTLTALPGLRAKRIVIDYLRENADNSDVCDKVIRCLGAPETGAEYFVSTLDDILRRYPAHPQLDGFIALREKLNTSSIAARGTSITVKGADIAEIDRILASRIADYDLLDETVRAALRSAELPYLHPDMFDEYVDKSGSLVEYCKAVDIQLEKTLGRKHLFSKLENQLHEFQSALHSACLNEDFPSADRVIKQMGLEKHFNAQSLPLHKMTAMAQGIRSGRIVHERFKTLDGLRAWAIMLLVFARKIQGGKPLIVIKNLTDDQIASFCKRLIALQEVRNPAAHRQTLVQFPSIDDARAEALALLNQIQKMF